MLHSAQLDWARREGYLWTRPCRRGWINSSSYSRKLESREITPRDLCKQKASTFGVWCWKSCVFEGFAHERNKEVWSETKISTSLHRTVPHPQEVWICGLQAWRSVWRHLWISCCLKWHRLRLTCRTSSTQSRFWIKRIMSQDVKQSSSSRYNGAITLKKRQLGRARTSSVLTIRTSCCHVEECAHVRYSC
jgi:hypothetical protein